MPWLVCDTDGLATAVWHERYVGGRSPSVEALAAVRQPSLYVLTGDDIPFVQDGMRDGEHLRGCMAQRFREVLAAQPVPWVEVRGGRKERVDDVLRLVQQTASSRDTACYFGSTTTRAPRGST